MLVLPAAARMPWLGVCGWWVSTRVIGDKSCVKPSNVFTRCGNKVLPDRSLSRLLFLTPHSLFSSRFRLGGGEARQRIEEEDHIDRSRQIERHPQTEVAVR